MAALSHEPPYSTELRPVHKYTWYFRSASSSDKLADHSDISSSITELSLRSGIWKQRRECVQLSPLSLSDLQHLRRTGIRPDRCFGEIVTCRVKSSGTSLDSVTPKWPSGLCMGLTRPELPNEIQRPASSSSKTGNYLHTCCSKRRCSVSAWRKSDRERMIQRDLPEKGKRKWNSWLTCLFF